MHFSYYRRPLFLLLLVYSCGILIFRDRLLNTSEKLPFALPRAGALLEGRVAEYPVAAPGGVRFTLETYSLYGEPFRTGLMVYSRGGAASYGDRVSMLADLGTPQGASVPGGLDWADYLSRRGIAAQARARELEVVKPAGPLLRLARRFRNSALGSFREGLRPEAAAVFGGIVLGDKKSVPPDLKAAFQDSGAMHLLVTSGAHVGFVAAVVYFLCARLRLRRVYSGAAVLAVTGFYVLAAGLGAPLVRAYIMLVTGFCAWLLRRESGSFQALCAAALFILLLSPRSLFDAGFQMSFLAAYGLTVGMPLWGHFIKARGLAGKALTLLLVSFFAQLCLYPLLALYFHKISLVSLLSNMLLVPSAGVAIAMGFALGLSGKGLAFRLLAWAADHFMALFIGAVRFFAGLPHAALSVPGPSAWSVSGFFVLALALLHAPLLGLRSRRLYSAFSAGVLLLAAGPLVKISPAGPVSCKAELFGDSNTSAALLSVPAGLFLVNPGMNGKKLAAAVLSRGKRSLRGVLLTSLEKKNYSGLRELSGMIPVESVFLPYGPRGEELDRALAGLEKAGARVYRVWPGELPVKGLDLTAAWGGGSGYSGMKDVLDWKIGGVSVSREGGFAERTGLCPGCAAPEGVSKESRKVTVLEFTVPEGGETQI